MSISVFVAEDHPVYRQGLVDALSARPDLELVGEAEDGPAALDALRSLAPDVALVDLKMPGIDGVELVRQLSAGGSSTKVIVLSGHTESVLVFEAIDAGASGFLAKESAAKEICDAIVSAASGRKVFSPGLQDSLVEQMSRKGQGADLSSREREILVLVSEGLTTNQIGEQLNLAEGTVKTYVSRAYEKLGVNSRAAAIAEAMRRGILS
jgi:two-component system nitrate/nitrite response regulator NarL